MQNDTPPAVDGSESTKDAIKQIYPAATDINDADLTDYQDIVSEYMALKRQKKTIDDLLNKHENSIKERIGDAQKGIAGKYVVSWSNRSRKFFDTEKLANENKNIDLSKYYELTSYRVLNVEERN